MPKSRPPYPKEFRTQMVELVRSGRTPSSLAKEFGCTAQSITTWVARADADEGVPGGTERSLTTAEREELSRLRREVRQLKQERDILANVWSAPVAQAVRCRRARSVASMYPASAGGSFSPALMESAHPVPHISYRPRAAALPDGLWGCSVDDGPIGLFSVRNR